MRNKDRLRIGTEPNMMTLLVDHIEIEPHAKMRGGLIESGHHIKFRYNLNDVLTQLLEDYGDELILARLKQIE